MKTAVALILLFILTAGCFDAAPRTSPVEASQHPDERAAEAANEARPEPTSMQEAVSLRQGASDFRRTFHLAQRVETGHALVFLSVSEDTELRQSAPYCFTYGTPLVDRSSNGNSCGTSVGNVQVQAPLGMDRLVLLDLNGPFPAGEYWFTFEAMPQLNSLYIDIEIPAV